MYYVLMNLMHHPPRIKPEAMLCDILHKRDNPMQCMCVLNENGCFSEAKLNDLNGMEM